MKQKEKRGREGRRKDGGGRKIETWKHTCFQDFYAWQEKAFPFSSCLFRKSSYGIGNKRGVPRSYFLPWCVDSPMTCRTTFQSLYRPLGAETLPICHHHPHSQTWKNTTLVGLSWFLQDQLRSMPAAKRTCRELCSPKSGVPFGFSCVPLACTIAF